MKAIISSTYDDKYLFFLPITAFCWHKLGYATCCFLPQAKTNKVLTQWIEPAHRAIEHFKGDVRLYQIECPENYEATYMQVARLFGAQKFSVVPKEIVTISDIDMAVFKAPPHNSFGFTVYGADLVPQGQVPMCYISAARTVWDVKIYMHYDIQKELDTIIGPMRSTNPRGDFWSLDQELAFKKVTSGQPLDLQNRARPGTQFASNRYDRDDSYLLTRLSEDTMDYHMPRPGYEEKNFDQILKVLQFHYPNDNFQWLKTYRKNYITSRNVVSES